MLVNIIHDPSHTDRYQKLQKEITENNLQVRFWPAIKDPEMPFRGICRAHKLIVMNAKANGYSSVCIAEDDLYFTSKHSWKYFLENIPMDYDLYLSGIYCGAVGKDNVAIDFCGMHLYIVHERFYDRFLSVPDENNIDRSLGAKAGSYKYVVSDPFIALQHNGFSYHKGMYAQYHDILNGRRVMVDLPNGEPYVYIYERYCQHNYHNGLEYLRRYEEREVKDEHTMGIFNLYLNSMKAAIEATQDPNMKLIIEHQINTYGN